MKYGQTELQGMTIHEMMHCYNIAQTAQCTNMFNRYGQHCAAQLD